ncbi:UDP-glucose--hexose-1-phosphate uridylyltransferase [Salimicrobium flavidum]|uniref:Galactose-1-phosphate uridylyltransferase n=1 Tax=Salimicrobium flavidum TaxID=570947 RepID=A0A1N7IZ47_9BACI|nr:UDP-glucose--hexose-1-phosphate uridylyltransferase [Salimicrobium flavidum]SIS42324.1 UTP-hexose-1-phosphate uridylyltransferase [Salimicrobium flavidum]
MRIYQLIDALVEYGVSKGLISVWDIDYSRNRLFHLFGQNGTEFSEYANVPEDASELLREMIDYAVARGLVEEDTETERDLFDAKIMNCLMPRPSEVIKNFYHRYETIGPVAATDFFYHLSEASHYIRTDRIAKNKEWISETAYGNMEITINLSKPEKDPKAIAAARLTGEDEKYPKCLLCKENVGYAGRLDHPARDNHRIVPVELEGEEWFFQYSPYVYYGEHAIVLSREHRPMKISRDGFDRLLGFVEQFPHYFVGSNADLPIVGGSILSHDHFQGGRHDFPMAKAPVEEWFRSEKHPEVHLGIVQWPMSVIRLRSEDRYLLSEAGEDILDMWRSYSDEKVGIQAESEGERHNTITPIARKRDSSFELDLVLRNNRVSDRYPHGIFHPHEEVHHIKKENIGLIEVMGLAVLPGRLVHELDSLAAYIRNDDWETRAEQDDNTAKHVPWVKEFINQEMMDGETIHLVLQREVGKRFSQVLEDAGVFKRNEEGKEAFHRFLKVVQQKGSS